MNAFARDLASTAPGMANGSKAGLDLLFGEIAATLAFRQAGKGQRERKQVEELAVAPLNVRRLAGLLG